MTPAKEAVKRILQQLPDDTTLEDIQYHIYIRQKVDHALEDVASGRTLTDKEFDARMAKWLEQ